MKKTTAKNEDRISKDLMTISIEDIEQGLIDASDVKKLMELKKKRSNRRREVKSLTDVRKKLDEGNHFNISIRPKASNHISLDLYLKNVTVEKFMPFAKYIREDINEDYVDRQRKRIKYNYELNMKYFESLDRKEFEDSINEIVKKYHFEEVYDLKEYENVKGIYMMVLDDYKQVYIGLSKAGIKERIQSHWYSKKEPFKLIFGNVFDSIISIDSFGALDTTRIFAIKAEDLYVQEREIVNDFNNKFLLNRTAGGIGSEETKTSNPADLVSAIILGRKKRDYFDFMEEKDVLENCNDYEIAMYKKAKEKRSK